jgi:hypothetical protein
VHGELAQVIALAAHGSAWLAGITPGPPPRLDAENTTFEFVRRVRFALDGSSASDVAGWLLDARGRGIERFWLSIPEPGVVTLDGQEIPDRMLVAFAGAGPWSLLATSPERPPEVWRASWVVGDKDAPDQKIWEVDYHGTQAAAAVAPSPPDMGAAAERLAAALDDAEGFARRHDLENWAEVFAGARRIGDGDDPPPSWHPDMLPSLGFSRPARRLVGMATRSWVFGGMGSWNDLGFDTPEDQEKYDRVSAELYPALLRAFVAGVNADLEA